MNSLITLIRGLVTFVQALAYLVHQTIVMAIMAPVFIFFTVGLTTLIPIYFWTLIKYPSWAHVYLAVIFIVVLVQICRDSSGTPPPVRRGRALTRFSEQRRPGLPDSPARPSSNSKIRRSS